MELGWGIGKKKPTQKLTGAHRSDPVNWVDYFLPAP